jgi:hypothetical protein
MVSVKNEQYRSRGGEVEHEEEEERLALDADVIAEDGTVAFTLEKAAFAHR